MTISTSFFRYQLTLVEGAPVQSSTLGYIVQMHDGQGCYGFGEVSDAALLGSSLSDETPALAFARSSASLSLQMAQKKVSLAALLNRKSAQTLCLNALLDASLTTFVDDGLRAYEEGFRTLKIKVTDANLSVVIKRIHALLKLVGTQVALRLDGNRALSLEAAVELLHALKKARIEYIEEPVRKVEDYESLFKLTGVPIALDEGVLEKEVFEHFKTHEAVSTFVLKASRVGAVCAVLEMMDEIATLGKKIVVTSCYETGMGLSMLAQIAALLPDTKLAMGLATYRSFASDILKPPFRAFRAHIDVQAVHRALCEMKGLEESESLIKI